MTARCIGLAGIVLTLAVSTVAGQATFTPSYNAPYRAFEVREFGGYSITPRAASRSTARS